ncbi:synaptobrevin-like, partial [Tropilaelaps mercedesae]
MDRRSTAEAERLLGGGLSDDDENHLESRGPEAQDDERTKPKQESNNSNRKFRKVQFEVEQVQGIMRDNVEKMLERGERVVELADKGEVLIDQADSFLQASKRMQQRLWWRQYKLRVVLGVSVITVLVII